MCRSLLAALVLGLLTSPPCTAQWWVDAGLPIQMANGVNEIYVDTTTGTMYCTGDMWHNMWTPEQGAHYCTYRNGTWTISDPFDNLVMAAVVYHDTLIIGGNFTLINGHEYPYIACLVDGQWQPYGDFEYAVHCLRVIDGELYATGAFTHVDGQLCNGVAKRIGNTWANVGDLPDMGAAVQEIIQYDGELYIVGALHYYDLGAHGVARYNGQQWLPVGNGIRGGFAVGLCLEVYQGELYMGGLIDIGAGNPGHAIMRWNGTEWRSVGTGVQGPTGTYDYLYTVNDLSVDNGLLYASGGFSYAGNVPAKYIATWDGERWCGLGGTFGSLGPIYSHGFFGDTLFVGCYGEADGQPVNSLARYIGTWPDTCGVAMGVGMAEADHHGPSTIASLGSGRYRFVGPGAAGQLQVHNTMGQVVRSFFLPWAGDGSEPFGLEGLAPGVYLVGLEGVARTKLLVEP